MPKRSKSRKSKSKNKKAQLTEEEKIIKRREKIKKEEEAKKSRIALTKNFLLLKASEERKILLGVHNKVLNFWRPHLRTFKIHELLSDYKLFHAQFLKNLDKKNQILAEQMSLISKTADVGIEHSHRLLETLDKIQLFFNKRRAEVWGKFKNLMRNGLYAKELKDKAEFEKNSADALNLYKDAEKRIKADIRRENDKNELYVEKERRALKDILEKELIAQLNEIGKRSEEVFDKFHDTISSQIKNECHKREAHKTLMERDEKISSEIGTLSSSQIHLKNELKKLEEKKYIVGKGALKILELKKEEVESLKLIKGENERKEREIWIDHNTALRFLSFKTLEIQEKLDKKLKLMTTLSLLAQDIILHSSQGHNCKTQPPDSKSSEIAGLNMNPLDVLLHKMAKTKLDALKFYEERRVVLEENKILKITLKKFLTLDEKSSEIDLESYYLMKLKQIEMESELFSHIEKIELKKKELVKKMSVPKNKNNLRYLY